MRDPEQAEFWASTIPPGQAAAAATRRRSSRYLGLFLLILPLGLVGALVGLLLAATGHFPTPAPPWHKAVYPLPHHIPKYAGGVSLRFAMVHDVIHERFPRHGKAYYIERNLLARQALEKAPDLSTADRATREKYFALMDDLGVGLDQLGEHDEAVRVLRGKLRQQKKFGWEGRDLYTTYANLGTSLIHGSFGKVRAGDKAARTALREGLDFIRKSIAVNPQAHFGREEWQAVVVEYLLACVDDPNTLLRRDLTGNRLEEFDPRRGQALPGDRKDEGQEWLGRRLAAFLRQPLSEQSDQERARLREPITKVGNKEGSEGIPFDEPVLGIIGMWRLGGGANPYFALALAEIMLRVGQRYIAWCGYERAVLLAGAYWPDPAIQAGLKEHCRKRQAALEAQLPNEGTDLRPRFQAELAHGQRYQREYQEYEAKQIAAGVPLDDPHFYDDFHKGRQPIASPVGPADQFVVESRSLSGTGAELPAMLLFAGLFAFSGALLMRLWRGSARQPNSAPQDRPNDNSITSLPGR